MLIINEIRKIPFFRLIIPFIGGIVFQIYFVFQNRFIFEILLVSIFITGVYKYFEDQNPHYHRRWISGILIFISLFLSGSTLTAYYTVSDYQFVEYDLFTAKIVEPVKESEKSIKAVCEISSFKSDSGWCSANERVIVYLQKDSIARQLNYGDMLIFNTRFHELKNSGNPYAFDYKKYLAAKNVYFQAFVHKKEWEKLSENCGNIIYAAAFSIRKKLITIYEEHGISGDEFSVLAALTLGVKDYLSDDILKTYSSTGAMHILAVSGLHVGIIYLILNSMLFFMNKNKYLLILKAVILIVLIWFFAFITGLSPSVRRASLMLTLIITGQITGRHPSIYNSIAASAFLILLVNPLSILQVGFQLSYAAVIAIVYFQPKIYRLFELNNFVLDKIWALTAVSLAAQIGTFPIAVYYFHKFPTYFFLSNLIVIPAAYLIISFAIALILLYPVGFLSVFFAKLLKYTIFSMNYLTRLIEKLPVSSINNISFSAFELMLLYLFIALFIIYFINYRRKFFVFSGIVLLLLFFSSHTLRQITALKQNELIVFNSSKSSFIALKSKDKLYALCDSDFVKSKNFHYLIDNYLTHKYIHEIKLLSDNFTENNLFKKGNYLKFGNIKAVILNNSHFSDKIGSVKLKVNLLIISKGFNANIAQVAALFDYDKIVLDASLGKWRENAIMRDCAALNINPIIIRESGAYVLPIAFE